MTSPVSEFRRITWDDNEFILTTETASEWSLVVRDVKVDETFHNSLEVAFGNPRGGWVMLWDEGKHEWLQHPDQNLALGKRIVEAFIKPIGRSSKLSFGVNDRLGWTRWGFVADSVRLSFPGCSGS